MAAFEIGQSASITRTITEADVAEFARLSGDYNPIHVDADYAKRTRFGGRIGHGMLTGALVSAVLGTKLPGPGGIFLSQTMKFLKPVRIGDTITTTATVTAYREDKRLLTCRTTCTNQQGEFVLDGEAVLLYEPVE